MVLLVPGTQVITQRGRQATVKTFRPACSSTPAFVCVEYKDGELEAVLPSEIMPVVCLEENGQVRGSGAPDATLGWTDPRAPRCRTRRATIPAPSSEAIDRVYCRQALFSTLYHEARGAMEPGYETQHATQAMSAVRKPVARPLELPLNGKGPRGRTRP